MRIALAAAVLLLAACIAVDGFVTTTSYTYNGGVDTLNVPANTKVSITANGAAGGQSVYWYSRYSGGRPMQATIEINVLNPTTLYIVSGQKGNDCSLGNGNYCGGGGGGGTFIYTSTGELWLAVGGGGGAANANGNDALTTTNGGNDAAGYAGGVNGANGPIAGGYYAKGWNTMSTQANFAGVGTCYGWGACSAYGGGGPAWDCNGGGGGGYSAGAGGYNSCGYYIGGGGGSYAISTANVVTPVSYTVYNSRSISGSATITLTTCTGAGTWFYANKTLQCSCMNGYSGTGCDTAPNGACSLTTPSKSIATAPPSTSTITFTNDALQLTLVNNFVRNRGYTQAFWYGSVDATTPCYMYPDKLKGNTYWSRTVSSCQDSITVNMPWASHNMCGFRNTSDDASWTFSGKAVIQYSEFLGNYTNTQGSTYVNVIRRAQHQYDVNVVFPRILTVQITPLNIESTVTLDMALTKDVYNSITGELSMEFTTGLYGVQVKPNATFSIPPNQFMSTNLTIDNTQCQNIVGTTCVQKFNFGLKLVNTSICTFDGTFTFTGTVTSCAIGQSCPEAPVAASFILSTGSVCAQVGVNLQLGGTLAAYATNSFTSSKTAFSLGDQIFFLVTPSVGTGNTVSVRFLDIIFNDQSNPGDIYLLTNGVRQVGADIVSLDLQQSQKYFSLYLYGQVFRQALGQIDTYVFTVRSEVTFNGNKKRMVEMTYSAEGVESIEEIEGVETIEDIEDIEEDGSGVKQQKSSAMITLRNYAKSNNINNNNLNTVVVNNKNNNKNNNNEAPVDQAAAEIERLKSIVIGGALFAGVLFFAIGVVVYKVVSRSMLTTPAAPASVVPQDA